MFTGKVEVGQNIRTSLAQQVAEELRVPFDSIEMVMGDTSLVTCDMGTFGSRTTATMGPEFAPWLGRSARCCCRDGCYAMECGCGGAGCRGRQITDPKTRRSLSYGELTHGENLVKIVSATKR